MGESEAGIDEEEAEEKPVTSCGERQGLMEDCKIVADYIDINKVSVHHKKTFCERVFESLSTNDEAHTAYLRGVMTPWCRDLVTGDHLTVCVKMVQSSKHLLALWMLLWARLRIHKAIGT